MRVHLMATQDAGCGLNEAHISQNELEYLGDFAEVILQFARAVGYTYVNQVIFVKDNGDRVETLR